MSIDIAKHNEVLKQWQPSGIDWDGAWHDVDFNQPSPTAQGETLGQSLQRLGNVLFSETQNAGSHCDDATARECTDLATQYDVVGQLFDIAVDKGTTIRLGRQDPMLVMMDLMLGRDGDPSVNNTGETNPAYGAVSGATSSVDYGEDNDI